MKLKWDKRKNTVNIRKHGFNFTNAWEIFEGPMLTTLDDRHDYGEERWVGIGSLRTRIVVVVFTEDDEDTIRIISLRKALSHERRQYQQYIRERLGTN